MVIDNSWQYVYAVEQDKKAQSALTIALKDTHNTCNTCRHTIHCKIMVQDICKVKQKTTGEKEIGLDRIIIAKTATNSQKHWQFTNWWRYFFSQLHNYFLHVNAILLAVAWETNKQTLFALNKYAQAVLSKKRPRRSTKLVDVAWGLNYTDKNFSRDYMRNKMKINADIK